MMDDYTLELLSFKKGGMPPRNKKNYRPTKKGAGMTEGTVKIQKNESRL